MTAALTVPKDWAELTPGGRTAALAEHHPDAVVDGMTVDMRDDDTNRPTAAHHLDSGRLPVKPNRVLANGDIVNIGEPRTWASGANGVGGFVKPTLTYRTSSSKP